MVNKKQEYNYGIYEYTGEQLVFHKDIMKVLKMKKHRSISADECMVVFGRCYATYALSQLEQEGKIHFKNNKRDGKEKCK